MKKYKVKIFCVGVAALVVLLIAFRYGYVRCDFTAKESDVSSVFVFRVDADEKKSLQESSQLFSERQGGVTYEQLRGEVVQIADKNDSVTVARRRNLDSGWFCRRGSSCAVSLHKGYLFMKFIDVRTYSHLEITDEDRID